jgi:predicted transcriptional regulator
MAMNVRFDEAETEALRRQAAAEHRSMQEVARAAVREYIDRRAHQDQVRESAQRNAERFAEVLHRLGTL